jgi:hypothetical protein
LDDSNPNVAYAPYAGFCVPCAQPNSYAYKSDAKCIACQDVTDPNTNLPLGPGAQLHRDSDGYFACYRPCPAGQSRDPNTFECVAPKPPPVTCQLPLVPDGRGGCIKPEVTGGCKPGQVMGSHGQCLDPCPQGQSRKTLDGPCSSDTVPLGCPAGKISDGKGGCVDKDKPNSESAPAASPWPWIAAAVLGVAAIGGVAYAVSNTDKSEPKKS